MCVCVRERQRERERGGGTECVLSQRARQKLHLNRKLCMICCLDKTVKQRRSGYTQLSAINYIQSKFTVVIFIWLCVRFMCPDELNVEMIAARSHGLEMVI